MNAATAFTGVPDVLDVDVPDTTHVTGVSNVPNVPEVPKGKLLIVARNANNPNDYAPFKWPRHLVKMSGFLSDMLQMFETDISEDEDIDTESGEIEVSPEILQLVQKWCEHHINDPPAAPDTPILRREDAQMPAWDRVFFRHLVQGNDDRKVYQVLMAANYMDIPVLKEYGVKTIASWVKDKDARQIREILKLQEDFGNV